MRFCFKFCFARTFFHTRVKGEHLAAERVADLFIETEVVVDATTRIRMF